MMRNPHFDNCLCIDDRRSGVELKAWWQSCVMDSGEVVEEPWRSHWKSTGNDHDSTDFIGDSEHFQLVVKGWLALWVRARCPFERKVRGNIGTPRETCHINKFDVTPIHGRPRMSWAIAPLL